MSDLIVIGAGVSGSEAAWQAAEQGVRVTLYEMRPDRYTEAHKSAWFAELVCSNSLGSNLPDRPSGLLKEELRRLDSMVLQCADATALPAGGALAVDRLGFSQRVTERLERHPNVTIRREEVTTIPETPAVIASGPLTSPLFSQALATFSGEEHLYFYDAIAPIVTRESIDMRIAFRASRYERGEQEEGDYINCPLSREAYECFVDALLRAERIPLHGFEREIEQGVKAGWHHFFEGCLPIEIIAQRGKGALAYGPMRPVGLRDPRTDKYPYAVLQLRQDNVAGSLYNLLGFQTNLKFPEQPRIFRMIPGLEQAEFVQYGQMHRNTFLAAPRLLYPTLQFKHRPDLFCAGQLTGVEGYVGNIATGWLAGRNASRLLNDQEPLAFPATTMIGALCHYVTHAELKDFQPMKSNFGLFPPLEWDGSKRKPGKRERAQIHSRRALEELEHFLNTSQVSDRNKKQNNE